MNGDLDHEMLLDAWVLDRVDTAAVESVASSSFAGSNSRLLDHRPCAARWMPLLVGLVGYLALAPGARALNQEPVIRADVPVIPSAGSVDPATTRAVVQQVVRTPPDTPQEGAIAVSEQYQGPDTATSPHPGGATDGADVSVTETPDTGQPTPVPNTPPPPQRAVPRLDLAQVAAPTPDAAPAAPGAGQETTNPVPRRWYRPAITRYQFHVVAIDGLIHPSVASLKRIQFKNSVMVTSIAAKISKASRLQNRWYTCSTNASCTVPNGFGNVEGQTEVREPSKGAETPPRYYLAKPQYHARRAHRAPAWRVLLRRALLAKTGQEAGAWWASAAWRTSVAAALRETGRADVLEARLLVRDSPLLDGASTPASTGAGASKRRNRAAAGTAVVAAKGSRNLPASRRSTRASSGSPLTATGSIGSRPVVKPLGELKALTGLIVRPSSAILRSTAIRPGEPRPGPKTAEPLTDTRWLLQLGLALGLAYLAFLTFWFSGTRLRRRLRGARF